MIITDLNNLDFDSVVKEVKEFLLENYGKNPIYGDKVDVYASDKWFSMLSKELYGDLINSSKFFNDNIYPLLKKEMNIIEGRTPFYDTLLI